MAVPNADRKRRIKRALAARDGAACFYCDTPFPLLVLATIDHLIPQSVMPGWHQANLVLACRPCNDAKADQLPQVFLRAAGRAPQLRRAGRLRATVAVFAAVLAAVRRRPEAAFAG